MCLMMCLENFLYFTPASDLLKNLYMLLLIRFLNYKVDVIIKIYINFIILFYYFTFLIIYCNIFVITC
ncbi:hypothetical protein H311_01845 [Anncaliia algerae PRA109]|nr:hypothetical protein H311_01845 [Anncaliia algerae PRA109]